MQIVHEAVIWIDICVCLPLTMLFICCMCCVKQRDQFPDIYYRNLFISNLILLCITMFWRMPGISFIVYYCSTMASLCFKMCIALERYIFITCPLLDCLRQKTFSVLVCVLIWAICTISIPLAMVLREHFRLITLAIFPVPLYTFCLVGTISALPAATSVPTEEKRRVVATLVLLIFNYGLTTLPAIILISLIFQQIHLYSLSSDEDIVTVILILFLVSSLADLILFAFKCKGPIDKLLACLCCCCTTLQQMPAADQCE